MEGQAEARKPAGVSLPPAQVPSEIIVSGRMYLVIHSVILLIIEPLSKAELSGSTYLPACAHTKALSKLVPRTLESQHSEDFVPSFTTDTLMHIIFCV